MDYKAFLHDIDVTKKELIDFTNTRNKVNISRVDKLVNDYLVAIAQGKYSLKSYKAKIIHNELDFHHSIKEVVQLKNKITLKLDEVINNHFQDYKKTQTETFNLATKIKELREFTQENRRQKHDVLLRKGNIEKDSVAKLKELEQTKKEKQDSFNEKSYEIMNKLSINLAKIDDKTRKSYQEFETELLECDDIKQIKELKLKIKDARLIGLTEEYDLKVQTYDTVMTEEIKFNNGLKDFIVEIEKFKKLTQSKIFEFDSSLAKLNLDNIYRDKAYDLDQKKNAVERLQEEINIFVDELNLHNEHIKKDYTNGYEIDDKLFVYNIIKVHLYKILICIHQDDLYDPLANVLYSVLDNSNSIYQFYKNIYENNLINHQEKEKTLLEALANYTPGKKNASKEEFLNNVKTSLDRYYTNFDNELNIFNQVLFGIFLNIINSIIRYHDDTIKAYNEKEENKKYSLIEPFAINDIVWETNYEFVDLYSFGYKKLVTSDIPLVQNPKKNETSIFDYLKSYQNILNKNINNEITDLETKNSIELRNIDKDYMTKMNNLEKKYKSFNDQNTISFINKEKVIKKSTNRNMINAKREFLESKAVL